MLGARIVKGLLVGHVLLPFWANLYGPLPNPPAPMYRRPLKLVRRRFGRSSLVSAKNDWFSLKQKGPFTNYIYCNIW